MFMLYGYDKVLRPWIEARLGHQLRDDVACIGIMVDNRLRAVVAYDTFSVSDCNMHIATDGSRLWASRTAMIHCFAYPFIQLGLRRVTAVVPASNHAALKLDRKLGFADEGFHPHAMPDDDCITLGLLRENCRWLPREYRG